MWTSHNIWQSLQIDSVNFLSRFGHSHSHIEDLIMITLDSVKYIEQNDNTYIFMSHQFSIFFVLSRKLEIECC